MKKRAPATEAASPAGSAPPDCADSSTFSATLVLPLAVTAASAEAVLALGAEMVKGTWRGRGAGRGQGAGRAGNETSSPYNRKPPMLLPPENMATTSQPARPARPLDRRLMEK